MASMTNKIERSWRGARQRLREATSQYLPQTVRRVKKGCVSCYLASGVGGVVGQTPGVMYSK